MIPLAAVIVVFTISNRGKVLIDLWPSPYNFEAPLFAAVLVAALVGFLCGGVISFVSAGRRRARNRQLMRMLDNSRREEAMLREQIKKLEVAVSRQSSAQILPAPSSPQLTKVDAA